MPPGQVVGPRPQGPGVAVGRLHPSPGSVAHPRGLRERARHAHQHSRERQKGSRPRGPARGRGQERCDDGLPAAALSRGRHPRALHATDEGRRAPVRLLETRPLLGDSSRHRRALERGFHGAARRARAQAADLDGSVRAVRRQRLSDHARPGHRARRRDLGRERGPAHRRPHVSIRRKEPLGNGHGGVGAPAPRPIPTRRPPSPTR